MVENVYALYKGDKFIDIGTKKELAKKFNWSVKFVSYLGTPSNKKRMKDNSFLTIKIGTTKDKNYWLENN